MGGRGIFDPTFREIGRYKVVFNILVFSDIRHLSSQGYCILKIAHTHAAGSGFQFAGILIADVVVFLALI